MNATPYVALVYFWALWCVVVLAVWLSDQWQRLQDWRERDRERRRRRLVQRNLQRTGVIQ